jgi:beta-lactam-binding protein with PASTA domain
MSWLRAILYCFVFVVVFAVAGYVTMKVLVRDEGTIACPDTVGKELSDARRLAEAKGLSVVVSRYEKRKDIPYNYVIAQRPEPSMPVRKGRMLSVVVSEGPLLVSIPLLTNHTLMYAQTTLKERYIPLKKTLYVPHGTAGTVVAQSPQSGRNIVDEEGMTLFVANSPKRYFLMADLVGKQVTEVIGELETKQIKYKITYVERPGRQAKTILETSILPRTVFGEEDTLEIKATGG